MSHLILSVLIIEDETPAAEKLERYLKRYSPSISVAAVVGSVGAAVTWLQEKQASIDLIFMDIQLTDGVSLSIFKEIKVNKPVIFVTAYNEFALDAFKVNSIDYLLKPVTYADLENSLKKLESLREQLNWSEAKSEHVASLVAETTRKNYKTRFMVKLGDHIRSITTDQVALFYADGRDVYLVTDQLRKFIVDYTLESVEELLDPKHFFRVSRAYIVHINAIQDVVMYSSSRLKITPHVKWEGEIIVSREKVNDFKAWFDGEH